MCGVIGLIFERPRQDLGAIAGDLLRMLEYRGYDSTGAAIQAEGPEVQLRKGVGAPSVMVERLGIVDLPGQILCAQVRWATFGAVNDENSQPHLVRCETYLYGAHNGNVTNCDELAGWLRSLGHRIVSDNDGEMVVHTVEHFFAAQLEALPEEARQEQAPRRAAMREALVQAAARLRGSYAAVIVDPIARTVWAIKAGSSLYLGVGEDAVGGRYALVSSDLSSVLRMTRILVPLAAGEAVEVDPSGVRLWSLRGEGAPLELERAPARSRLRAKDAALMPPFESFMDQEIHAQEEACRDVLRIFQGGSPASRLVGPFIDMMTDDELEQARDQVDHLLDQYEDDAIAQAFAELMRDPSFRTLQGRMPAELRREASEADELELAGRSLADSFHSAELGFFADLLARARTAEERLAVRLLDAWLEREEVGEYMDAVAAFSQLCIETMDRGSRIYIVCCGTSFHAAKAASLFFSELARTEVLPLLPGEFRGQHAATLRDGDLLVAVSQSGETKDLIDVIDMAMASGRRITRVGLVNNVNSTLAQEKSDVVIPLRCGPEIAVPATKSFMNQLTVFYCLAVRLAERRITTRHVIEGQAGGEELSERNLRLPALPELVRRTIEQTEGPVEEAAELVYLAPSMHLLATRLLAVAKEGALKIREVVLNHTEGFEASEFKHGPNTILGFNTLFGPRQVHAMLETLGEGLGGALIEGTRAGLSAEALGALAVQALGSLFTPGGAAPGVDREAAFAALGADYPLVFITGPEERDVALTISQINTHKIRGAMTLIVAEPNEALRQAASKAPADNAGYRSVYIELPETGDTLMTVISASVALQRLALKMSLKKMAYLDALGVRDHGVHPDVPKNVSKSITVD